MERQKFFYKLCVVVKGRLFFYCSQGVELEIGQVIVQDSELGSKKIVVYRSPEQAYFVEAGMRGVGLGARPTKTSQKTVIKAMCWGKCSEAGAGFVFANMCVVENVGLVQIRGSNGRESSFLRSVIGKNRKAESISVSYRSSKRSSPFRGYIGANAKEITPRNRKNASVPRGRIGIEDMLKRMKEDSEKIDREIEDIERWNLICALEVIETEKSSEILED